MTMIKYVLREDTIYGINAVDDEGNILKTASELHTDKEIVENFINICNAAELELIHFEDVIEDLKHK